MSKSDKHVCAVFILKTDGSALLQHRDDKPGLIHPGKWTIPGGHREKSESTQDCARREVAEECNYRCKELFELNTFELNDGNGYDYTLTLFWTPLDPDQEKSIECREGQAMTFVEREAANSLPILQFLLPYWDRSIAMQKSRK